MKIRILLFIGIIITCLISGCISSNTETTISNNGGPVFTDSTGAEIALPHTASRIVSTNGDATEMLLAIGASDLIVGVTDSDLKNPLLAPYLKNSTNIGDWLYPDVEALCALKPDVLISYSRAKPKNIEKIIASNITIVYIDGYKIGQLNNDAEALGIITGRENETREYIKFNRNYQDLISEKIKNITPDQAPRVYVEAYTENSVMAKGSAGGDILDLLHATNLYGESVSDWVHVSPEWIITQNPEIILKFATNPASSGESLASVHDGIEHRLGYSNISAVKKGKIFVFNADLGSSPRGIIGLLYCAKALYPEEFADIDPDDAVDEYASRFVKGTDKIETYYPPLHIQ